jgi:hypothetical protein
MRAPAALRYESILSVALWRYAALAARSPMHRGHAAQGSLVRGYYSYNASSGAPRASCARGHHQDLVLKHLVLKQPRQSTPLADEHPPPHAGDSSIL